ncbi:hypothetical protein ACIBJE_28360 [Micromonospora sp. NPDC050187]|uniref:hypothetical protein n=1 Tax=Micromonospora sp. NPDC050187 TaxID=3364277 RepID=UPI0037BC87C1
MKATKATLALACAFGMFLTAPTPASAKVASAGPVVAAKDISIASSLCSTGRVVSIAANLPIRVGPYMNAELVSTAQRGYQYSCWGFTVSGDWVQACGAYSNVWIALKWGTNGTVYTYAACMDDV